MPDQSVLSDRVKTAIKTALATVLAYGVVLSMEWGHAYWAAFAVAFCTLSTVGESLNKGLLRLSGTLLGSLTAVILIALFPQDRWAALWFRKAAQQGYALAQANLGVLYRDGRGVTEDVTEAVMWFRKAADQGDAVAEFRLGNQYAFGKGVPQDYSEAMIWYRKAAEQGHRKARLFLGIMCAEGRGVQGSGNGRTKDTPAQINEARKLARDWKPATQPSPR
jgi:Fusaric acid resistance protein family/Sel1 repeat